VAGEPTALPRLNVVFRLWQCDKENHGWREGPPLTVACKSSDLLAGPSPSRYHQIQTKKEYRFTPGTATSQLATLAGYFAHPADVPADVSELACGSCR
jgi:hypothetical protein